MTVEPEIEYLNKTVTDKKDNIVYSKNVLEANINDSAQIASVSNNFNNDIVSKSTEISNILSNINVVAGQSVGTTSFDDLSKNVSSILTNAVDFFIYDTSKDSDGGAWRKRTTGTSWYNEPLNTATRGSRREFPAVAVIVAESNKVTIYDGDNPDLPMWMVFNGTSDTPTYTLGFFMPTASTHDITSISAMGGRVVFGVSSGASHPKNGLCQINFVSDNLSRRANTSAYGGTGLSVVQRHQVINLPTALSNFIINNTVNDVAMTVLPDAPIDPATGLPVPTIAVATDGGTSVIKDDGTVVDLINYVTAPTDLAFVDVGGIKKIWTTSRYRNWINIFDIPDSDIDTGQYLWGFQNGGIGTWFGYKFIDTDKNLVVGANRGVVLYNKDEKLTNLSGGSLANRWQQMTAVFSTKYNTGWLNGEVKGIFMSDTDNSDLIGSNNLVSDDRFVWEQGIGWSLDKDILNAEGVTSDSQYLSKDIGLIEGKMYRYSMNISGNLSGTNYLSFRFGGTYDSFTQTTSGIKTGCVIANGSGLFRIRSEASLSDISISDLSITLVDYDRSVINNGLDINGVITRTPVATGAELVGYSGFSTENYLEQPYNPDLDFGTGDFCVMGWHVKSSTNVTGDLLKRLDASDGGAGFKIYRFGLFNTTVQLFDGTGGSKKITSELKDGWNFICLVRKGDSVFLYSAGVLQASATGVGTYDISNANGVLKIGGNGSLMALWRISATAPTPDQIKKIYEDEKFLFQENASCTLYGTSGVVTALAHDSDTDLLHVGTSSGRSVFDGLVRVEHTKTPITTAISANNGIILEQ